MKRHQTFNPRCYETAVPRDRGKMYAKKSHNHTHAEFLSTNYWPTFLEDASLLSRRDGGLVIHPPLQGSTQGLEFLRQDNKANGKKPREDLHNKPASHDMSSEQKRGCIDKNTLSFLRSLHYCRASKTNCLVLFNSRCKIASVQLHVVAGPEKTEAK
jgi:hypothetical protein